MDIRLISPEEAAEIMSLKKNTVYDMIQRGNLRAIRMGKQFRILKKDLYSYLGIQTTRKEILTICGQSPLVDQLCSIYNSSYGEKFDAVCLPCDSYQGIYYMYFHENAAAVSSLWDPVSNSFNASYARRLLPGEDILLFRLGCHEIGLYVPKGNPEGITDLKVFANRDLRLCRPAKGRDSRIYFDHYCLSGNFSPESFHFSKTEAVSDLRAAFCIQNGEADAALADYNTVAKDCGLDFIPLKPAYCDIFIRTADMEKKKFQNLVSCIRSEEFYNCSGSLAPNNINSTGDHII